MCACELCVARPGSHLLPLWEACELEALKGAGSFMSVHCVPSTVLSALGLLPSWKFCVCVCVYIYERECHGEVNWGAVAKCS